MNKFDFVSAYLLALRDRYIRGSCDLSEFLASHVFDKSLKSSSFL